jgi:hypothetical protein
LIFTEIAKFSPLYIVKIFHIYSVFSIKNVAPVQQITVLGPSPYVREIEADGVQALLGLQPAIRYFCTS